MAEWKGILVHVVNSDHRNNSVKFEKDLLFYFWVFRKYSWASLPIEINGNKFYSNFFTVKLPKKYVHTVLIFKKQVFQIKKLNEVNFFLIIIYILIQFKVFIYSPENSYGPLTLRIHCYWSINHHNAL